MKNLKSKLTPAQADLKNAKAEARKAKAEATSKAAAKLFASHRIPKFVTEYMFAKEYSPSREWRMDYAWPEYKVFLEVEGGIWSGGRHTRGAGFLADMEKYNAAARNGWLKLSCTPYTLLTLNTARDVLYAIYTRIAEQAETVK